MKILITGAGGFIGSHLINFLYTKNLNVVGVIRKNYPKYINKKIKILELDLSKVNKSIGEYECVIHCAVEEPNKKNLSKIMDINLRSINNILNHCKNVKHIIYLSSMAVYGSNINKFIYEKTKINHQSIYGKIKYKIEEICLDHAKKNGISLSVLRLPGVVGYGSKDNFISKTLHRIKLNQKIIATDPNSKFNNIITSETLNHFIYKLIKKNSSIKYYTLGSKYPLKIKNVINYLYKLLEKKPNISFINSSKVPFIIKYSNAKKMGYKPITVKKSLISYVKSNSNN